MKIVMASTKEQEELINELIQHLFSHVFPLYFNEADIEKFKELHVLNLTDRNREKFGTLRDSFRVIASLQTITSILETSQLSNLEERYASMFEENCRILQQYGIGFPFLFSNFSEIKSKPIAVSNLFSQQSASYVM